MDGSTEAAPSCCSARAGRGSRISVRRSILPSLGGATVMLFRRTIDLVQPPPQARQALSLESAIDKLDKYHLLILDDLCYVRQDQAETSVLFELIAARYERRSLMVTANHPFGEWTTVFQDAAMTLAAVDRLVHHSTIFDT